MVVSTADCRNLSGYRRYLCLLSQQALWVLMPWITLMLGDLVIKVGFIGLNASAIQSINVEFRCL